MTGFPLSPRVSAYRFDPIGFAENILGIWLHEEQKRIFREAFRFDPKTSMFVFHYVHLSAGNRFGKSVILAVLHLWFATFKHQLWLPGLHPTNPDWDIYSWFSYPISIINLAPLRELAGIVRDKIDLILQGTSEEQLKNPNGRGHVLDGYTDLFVRDEEGKFLVATSPESDYKGFKTIHNVTLEYRTTDDNARAVQGEGRYLITIDEAGRQPKTFTGLMGAHIQPRVMDTPGIIVDVTTPDVDTNNDYEDWHLLGLETIDIDGLETVNTNKKPDHYATFGSTVDYDETKQPKTFEQLKQTGRILNPFVTWEMVEKALQGASPYLWAQILKGRFIQSEEAFYNAQSIRKSRVYDALDRKERARRLAGHTYVIGCDLAVAKAGDHSVFVVWDITIAPWRVVYYKKLPRGTAHPVLIDDMKKLVQYYDGEWMGSEGRQRCRAELIYDGTGMAGRMFSADMAHIHPRPRPFDYAGSGDKKLSLIKSLGITLDKQLLQIPAEFLDIFDELRKYKRQDDKLKTDSVMAMALANHWAENAGPRDNKPKRKIDFSIY